MRSAGRGLVYPAGRGREVGSPRASLAESGLRLRRGPRGPGSPGLPYTVSAPPAGRGPAAEDYDRGGRAPGISVFPPSSSSARGEVGGQRL